MGEENRHEEDAKVFPLDPIIVLLLHDEKEAQNQV
eukprot:CAMPEP_0115500496 /NCGR_PEP_ID=MMETSP0271-20121206/67898_1 /TAXON_ID=71861 /ORGANISM="Scrippsiella trochoidea, Strain CCMP3099" /LENGTH=34 /DNA_ID= /DNA_START= /DNA_END= /DNA_ORIENTATION=